jgi:hypothetical protein
MDPVAIFQLITLMVNVALQIPAVQKVTKGDYSQLALALEGAITPLFNLFKGMIGGGPQPAASDAILAGYATALGVLNALRKQPGLPQELIAKLDEYALGGQDAITGYLAASKGFDPTLFTPVSPMPPAA